ncbi:MAG: ribosome maturation factor RimM [Firmicutes bacterium]|nr:ribosome maturation factor RimM [Bacillota bacterium]
MKPFLQIGKIVGTHGVRGELRVQPWCDSPAFLCRFRTFYLEEGKSPVRVRSARVQKNLALVSLEGVDSIEQGDQLRGRILWIRREDAKLEPGKFFIQDLIGLTVRDADTGVCYGSLTDVISTGRTDVYEVTGGDKIPHLFPAIRDIVIKTDPESGEMLIRPIGGIFDDAD